MKLNKKGRNITNKLNYLNELPEELSCKIYGYYLYNIIKSEEFNQKRKNVALLWLMKTKSQKQLRQLGII